MKTHENDNRLDFKACFAPTGLIILPFTISLQILRGDAANKSCRAAKHEAHDEVKLLKDLSSMVSPDNNDYL